MEILNLEKKIIENAVLKTKYRVDKTDKTNLKRNIIVIITYL